ncbi:MAG: PfkB family carbohydrate kinase [Alphaproteobacteria bacterium]
MLSALERLKLNRFAVLGRAGLDLYAEPAGVAQEDAEMFFGCLGGSAGNIAAGLARQAADVALVSAVSDDGVGRFTLNALRKFGIATDHVRVVTGEMRTSLAVVDTLGDATEAVIYRNDAADFAVSVADVAAVPYDTLGALVVTGTALAAEPSRGAALAAIEGAREAGAAVVLDVDYRPYSWSSHDDAQRVYRQAAEASDIIIGNDVEFAVMAGGPADGLPLARTLSRDGARLVIFKMGADGAVTLTGQDEIASAVFNVKALKPTGAGDAFMAGLLAALGRGLNLRSALVRGSAAAAIVVSKVGCSAAMPRFEEIDAFLRDHTDQIIAN